MSVGLIYQLPSSLSDVSPVIILELTDFLGFWDVNALVKERVWLS